MSQQTRSRVDYRADDKQIWEQELADFVPQRVFDAHIHMFSIDNLEDPQGARAGRYGMVPSEVDLACLHDWASRLYPGRQTHFLVLGHPVRPAVIDPAVHARWFHEQLRHDPLSRFNRLVTPKCTVAQIERDVKQFGAVGLKPYRFYSMTGDVDNCRMHEFFPHEQMELANDLGLWVTMHLSRLDACADEQNLDDLEEFTTRRYPRIKWILAHCARSFTYWPIRQAIDRLRQMPQIWYDLSAVTDLRPMLTLFEKEDLKRIFYGSDGVDATYFHGAYSAMGRAWQSIDTDAAGFTFNYCRARPVLSVNEQLLSMKHAAQIAGLSRQDIEGIFWKNATSALGIDWDAPDKTATGAGRSKV